MIITRDMTPRTLSYKSRDFQLLLTLLDLVANSVKLDIDYLPNLINPAKCKSNWLEVLGSLVGYTYDETLSTEQNRFIISNFKSLMRLRGSQQGIELAVAIYLKLVGRDDTRFRVTIPTKTTGDMVQGVIYINDELLDLTKVPLLSKILEWVRPVGVNYVLKRSTVRQYINNLDTFQDVWAYQMEYPLDVSSKSGLGTREDRSLVHPGGLTEEQSRDKKDFDITNPDNTVGHAVVSDKED